jgi:hypothetical protein
MRLQQVRRPGVGLTTAIETLGDGPGGENTIDCGQFNELELYIQYRRGTTGAGVTPIFRLYWSEDNLVFLQGTFYTDQAAASFALQTFQFGTGQSDFNTVVAVPVRGRFCRVSVTVTDAGAPSVSVGIQALPRLR